MKQHNAKLIDGIFTTEQAKRVLLELWDRKISFHTMEKFSNEIRFGNDIEQSEKRIKELIEERNNLINWLVILQNTDRLKINCVVEIKVVE